MDSSQLVARAYIDQQAQIIRTDIVALKSEFEIARPLLIESPERFQGFIASVAASRGDPGIFLLSGDGEVIANSISDLPR